MHADLSNLASDILSIIPHGVVLEASVSLGPDIMSWRHTKSNGAIFRDTVIATKLDSAIETRFAGDSTVCEAGQPQNDFEFKREGEETKLNKIARVEDVLEMWSGQAKPMCFTDGILHPKHTNDSCRIHFRYWRDHQSILVKLSTWWCGCIQMVRKMIVATRFVCKRDPWKWNSGNTFPQNQKNWLLSSQMWLGQCTCNNFQNWHLAWQEWWHG